MSKKRRQIMMQDNNVIQFNHRKRLAEVNIIPKNYTQKQYLKLLNDHSKYMVFATGPAGTGKTLLAVLSAIKAFKYGDYKKIVVTRPAVSVDEQHGFLPGTLIEKMAPWTRPIFDVFEDYYSPKHIELMLNENIIEIAPLAFMRGRTFKNAWIIADEMQNATSNQMKMLLTRLGEGSRMTLTGDTAQFDKGYEENGLKTFLEKLEEYHTNYIGWVQFTKDDIERHPAVEEVLTVYGD